ncbi:hypothetical protein ES708_33221 [subsurface metagenome]
MSYGTTELEQLQYFAAHLRCICGAILVFNRIPANRPGSIVGRQDVLRGCFLLYVVDCVEHKPAAGGKHTDSLSHFPLHLFGGGEGKSFLRIHPAAPEGNLRSKFVFQPGRIHSGRRSLHGIEDVQTRLDQHGNDLGYRTAGVLPDLPVRVPVHPLVLFFEVGKKQLLESFRGEQLIVLGPIVRAVQTEDIDAVFEIAVQPFQILQRRFGPYGEKVLYIGSIHGQQAKTESK